MKISLKHLFYSLVLIFLFILLKTAWVSDDAFLTMRSVDNFINGYGLRWNILERVQIYTHPLWMFLLSGIYCFFPNPLVSLYFLSIIISMATVYFFGAKFATNYVKMILGFSILFFSKSFIDYSTSGLENPLTHLLMLSFLSLFLSQKEFSKKRVFFLFFIASLVAVNRMDTFLILIPSLLYILYQKRNLQTLLYATLGFSPFALWELFSLIYYGFLFPNTAYAKLAMGIDGALLVQHGYSYFLDSLLRDPLTLFVIFSAILFSFFEKNKKNALVALGIFLYLIYIIKIGGDYMGGRFFSSLLLMATVILMNTKYLYASSWKLKYFLFLGTLFLLRFYSLSPYALHAVTNNGIVDTRIVYTQETGLSTLDLENLHPESIWVEQGLRHKAKGRTLTVGGTTGMFAFYAGPRLHVVDTYALGDPLLARLPTKDLNDFFMGHFTRNIPLGYWRCDSCYGDRIRDENLRKYYEKLSFLIHREPLFSLERAVMIWRMNTGYYDYLLDAYLGNLSSSQEE